ncbi:MAG: adenosylcobinamide-GDP ribazoletransferase [Lentisphaerae bacterium]|nr:adenosylcobinamide-GDP ribazoletransferase [Lentisphaerota bacterium]
MKKHLFRIAEAVRTLTIIPTPYSDTIKPSDSLPYFPIPGLILGALTALTVQVVFYFFYWSFGAALAGVLISVVLTRGLHIDGIADTADGFFGSTKRENRLAIMKDSRVGVFGVIAIVFTVFSKVLAIEHLVQNDSVFVLIPVFVIARCVMSCLAVSLPYARAEGGTGKPYVEGAKKEHAGLSVLLTVLIMLFFTSHLLLPFVVIGGLLFVTLHFWFMRYFGGITGDLLGTANEVVEIVLVVMCVAIAV